MTNMLVQNSGRNMEKSVAVVGCGWFGLALAKQLVNEGYRVTGCKRNKDELAKLTEIGIEAYQLQLGTDGQAVLELATVAGLFQTDFLVVNLPPKLQCGNNAYLAKLQQLLALIQGWHYQRIIFISTTAVYPNQDRIMTEADAAPQSRESQVLLDAEALFRAKPNVCIVRFAGLIGPKRHPGRFFAGKTDVAGANVVVNLVHLTDCVRAVSAILASHFALKNIAPIYNLCAPMHLTKAQFYAAATASLGLVIPEFNHHLMPSKVIKGDLIVTDLGFNYQYVDPLLMLTACMPSS